MSAATSLDVTLYDVLLSPTFEFKQTMFGTHPQLFERALIDLSNVAPNAQAAYNTNSANGTSFREYNLAMPYAAALLLTEAATITVGDAGTVHVACTVGNQTRTYTSQPTPGKPGHRTIVGAPFTEAYGVPLLFMAEALTLGNRPQTLDALTQLARLTSFPAIPDALRALPGPNPNAVNILHRVSDYTYDDVASALEANNVTIHLADAAQPDTYRMITRRQLAAKLVPASADTGTVTNRSRLRRTYLLGHNAMLVGPPATFKTSDIQDLAVEMGCWMVSMRGAPSVEDRDFIGAISPTEHGPRWVDGPLARAFALGAQAKGIVKIDEVLRYQAETFNSLITAMDELSYADARTVLETPLRRQGAALLDTVPEDDAELAAAIDAQVEAVIAHNLPDARARYYMLELPSGETLFAPTGHVVFLSTTNWGENHIQTSSSIDAAFLSRQHAVIEYDRPDPEKVERIYAGVAGHRPDLIAVAQEISTLMDEEHANAENLFERNLDVRKMKSFLEIALVCLDEGMTMDAAVLEAATSTLVSHVCPRDSRGHLEAAARERCMNIVQTALTNVG